MKIGPINFNNLKKAFSAGNFKTPVEEELRAVKRFTNCALNGLTDDLTKEAAALHPEFTKKVNEEVYVLPATLKQKVIAGVKSFVGLPLDFLDAIAKKFPGSALDKAKFLQKHREYVQFEEKLNAARGIYDRGFKLVRGHLTNKRMPYPATEHCNDYCRSVCAPVSKPFYDDLNKVMGDYNANYDTKKERLSTRIISGIIAAIFLGKDFFNKAIGKGKNVEDAKKEQHLKQRQEIKENICEGITQFAVFSCFSQQINKKPWLSAVIGAGVGLVSRVISRVSSGMPLTRIDVPEKIKSFMPSMNEFVQSAKEGNSDKIFEIKKQQPAETKEDKKPILSMKNILLFCAASIACGYSMRFMKNHTKAGEAVGNLIQSASERLNRGTIEKYYADTDAMQRLQHIFYETGENHYGDKAKQILFKAPKVGNKLEIGTDYKTRKILGVEVREKELRGLITAPLHFAKELVSYPYKIAVKIEEAIKKARGISVPPKQELDDPYEIMNIYKRFAEFDHKYKDDPAKLKAEFTKYMKEMRIKANNNVSSSKGDNSKIAVMAQTLGTLTGMWFNMNDEFNSSVRNGSTKETAEKDARLRGINKFFRMSVQVIISGALNGIFAKQYNSSIAKSAAVVAATTVLTDGASRILSGMPTKKMTKDELENYTKKHKEGAMAWYYKMIDKLAS